MGPYEIGRRLGAGGTGEVYRARRARFDLEARAASALNHPNFLSVHDIGEEGGVSYIVTELVEGESLRALIERGPVPARKLIDIAAVNVAESTPSIQHFESCHFPSRSSSVLTRLLKLGPTRCDPFGHSAATSKFATYIARATLGSGASQPLAALTVMLPGAGRATPGDAGQPRWPPSPASPTSPIRCRDQGGDLPGTG
jgi:hypothetical protein